MEALRRALTPRQRLFAEEYIIDFNGSAACLRAGYAPKYADRQASILLDHEGIMAYIDHLAKSAEAKIMATNPDWVIQKTTKIINKEGVRDGDALRGLELLARILGMLKDRTEISGPDGEAIRIEQQKIDEDVSAVQSLINHLSGKKTVFLEKPDGP